MPIKLFCLPYAGGTSMMYLKWKKYLHPSIELCPIELAGRGRRITEPYYRDLETAVNDIYASIGDILNTSDYAIFGHSMGSAIAYELAKKIAEMGDCLPKHLFISGRAAPHICKERQIHQLPDQQFLEEIKKFGGTPQELLENTELLELFLPILRADFKIIESYRYQGENNPLNCNITVLGGRNDDIGLTELAAWQHYTHKEFQMLMFEGGHFFLINQVEKIAEIINDSLTKKFAVV